jgi:ubiquinone/menaquinone biosynthesis C-methylase UbiE
MSSAVSLREPAPAAAVQRPDFVSVSETPGTRITREALAMACGRYGFAARRSAGLDVLELACGSGQGLGWLARHARRVIAADCTASVLRTARGHYGDRIPFVQLDAQVLPFQDRNFDVVVLYEAIYYLPDAAAMVRECRRVLRPSGRLLICTVNREWTGFNPSPFSTKYFSAGELRKLLQAEGFRTELYAAFPVRRDSALGELLTFIKRLAVRFNAIPKTMRGKQVLKRIFLGPLTDVPAELSEDTAGVDEPVALAEANHVAGYKILYAVAHAH